VTSAVVQPDAHDVAAEQRRHDEIEVVIVVDVNGCDAQRTLSGRKRNGLMASVRQLNVDSVAGAAVNTDMAGDREVGTAIRIEVRDC
jgi:hypothetical protein